ncbi:lytic polysaccharide monooxygenase [Dactylosporangium sucinum]|uniref:Chitin-binding protein n=1 Tax=Dactylosporangium sucinum TaxID=1424081 RepID=A0A917WUF1_9ACTN|nr:lytic polysaccharide monooxygenase [Dactylosporangium sucinum]GGM28893.1 chitin-binding protein [Dactylosporangium sucinum]
MPTTARRAAVLVLGLVAALLVAPTPAQAHGVAMAPGSRTYLCYVDGLRSNGQIIPTNPACADAVAQGGQQPLYDWFGVLRSDANGRTTGFIPDGQICGAGTTKYAAYNAARTDWPTTHLTAGSTIQLRYSNWAAHPGTFHVYITKNGWNPTTPLAWGDLESFWSSTDPPQSGPAGGLNYYYFNTTLPAGKSGRHILYVQWVRSDSQENFFSCSDVVFDGGNGEVTGIGGTGNPSPSASVSSSPSPRPSVSTSPSPSRSPSASASPSGGTGTGGCTATWNIVPSSWAGHFQAEVTVKNNGTGTLNGWTVRWTYQNGQGFEGSPWNGTVVSQPPNVAVKNVDWNRVLGPGASTSFGFNATGTAPATAPALTCTSP